MTARHPSPSSAARPRPGRRAMTLLEVLTALAIFLMAMVVFGGIVVRNGEIALDIQRRNLATRLCQSKMAEVESGLVPLSSDSGEPFDDEPNFTWSVDAEQGSVDGLWNVTVTVAGPPTSDGQPVQAALMQMVLDPSVVGSTQDVTPVTTSSNSNSTTESSSSSSSPSSSPAPAATPTPAAATPAPATAAPAAAAPATTTTRPSTTPTPASTGAPKSSTPPSAGTTKSSSPGR